VGLWALFQRLNLCLITDVLGYGQEMTLDEYEKMMEEKRANLNKPAAPKAAAADAKAFEGMKAYTRKVWHDQLLLAAFRGPDLPPCVWDIAITLGNFVTIFVSKCAGSGRGRRSGE
jgi:hypothetical protein